MRDFLDLVAAAEIAAEAAATILRSDVRPSPEAWREKGPGDFVTAVDRAAEAVIAEQLSACVPGSIVMGEELSPEAPHGAGVVWIVDPLDGTANYLHGYPQFAVSIAAAVDGVLAAGVVLDVPRNVCYRAWRGGGAWAGRDRLAVSRLQRPDWALVGTGYPFKQLDLLPTYQRQFAEVMRGASGVRRAGAASLDLADVAAGRFDAFWELILAPWDVAAGAVLVREAGGLVTTMEGDEDVLRTGSIVAGSPVLHAWLLELLRHA
jgi:myo-inositol-1(or 4)-monophosphatase